MLLMYTEWFSGGELHHDLMHRIDNKIFSQYIS